MDTGSASKVTTRVRKLPNFCDKDANSKIGPISRKNENKQRATAEPGNFPRLLANILLRIAVNI